MQPFYGVDFFIFHENILGKEMLFLEEKKFLIEIKIPVWIGPIISSHSSFANMGKDMNIKV